MTYENLSRIVFETRDRKKHWSSRTLRLSSTPQSGHLRSLNWLSGDPRILAVLKLLAFLSGSDLLRLLDARAIACEGTREDSNPLGSGRLSFGSK